MTYSSSIYWLAFHQFGWRASTSARVQRVSIEASIA
jgi:hypothetical protein